MYVQIYMYAYIYRANPLRIVAAAGVYTMRLAPSLAHL